MEHNFGNMRSCSQRTYRAAHVQYTPPAGAMMERILELDEGIPFSRHNCFGLFRFRWRRHNCETREEEEAGLAAHHEWTTQVERARGISTGEEGKQARSRKKEVSQESVDVSVRQVSGQQGTTTTQQLLSCCWLADLVM